MAKDLDNLLLMWQEQHFHGRNVSPAELCRDCPELAGELSKRIQVLQRMDALLQPDEDTAAFAESVKLPPATPSGVACAGSDGAATVHSLISPAPAQIGVYKIIATLDAGGQGVVYRAVHPVLGRDVVIKIGRAPVRPDEGIDALIQEGRILAELDDPGLARIYDLFLHEGRPCLVMEYVRGRNLGQDARDRPRTSREAAALVAQVARALAVAHRRGVIHCDIKPGNILIDEAGQPRLIDFGVARLEDAWRRPSEDGSVSGTVSYMAPEQARGETPAPHCDLFALGGVLCFLLTGQAPFRGESFAQVLDKARRCDWDREALARAQVPARLRVIVEKALAAEPSARPTSAEELARDLEKFAQPSRTLFLLACGGAALLAVVAVWIWADFFGPASRDASSLPPPAAKPVHEKKAAPFAMKIRVWRANRYIDLADAAPVSAGDEIRIETVAPAAMHAALFARASSGKLTQLAVSKASPQDRPFAFPENPQKAIRLTGPPGNELILCCARRSGPIDEQELRGLLPGSSAWPVLPAGAVLGLDPRGPMSLLKSRDLGILTDRADPEAEVHKELQELGRRLRLQFDHFEAIVFSHGE